MPRGPRRAAWNPFHVPLVNRSQRETVSWCLSTESGANKQRLALRARNVLIEQERIAVRVGDHEVRGPLGRLVRFGRHRESTRLQGALQLPHVLEVLRG